MTQASCEGYKKLQAQLAINAKLEKDIVLERERLRILTGKIMFGMLIHYHTPLFIEGKHEVNDIFTKIFLLEITYGTVASLPHQ